MTIYYALVAVWLVWWGSWWAAAWWSSQPTARLPAKDEMRHRIFLIAGVALLLLPFPWLGSLVTPLWSFPTEIKWALVLVAAFGFAFCWWARIHLGTLWSGTVTRKADHRIVDTGPYALVRHPIYTGIIIAALASALERGTAFAVAGAALVIVSFSMKARMEESFLRTELGPDSYDNYRRRVPMLVPFWPVGRS